MLAEISYRMDANSKEINPKMDANQAEIRSTVCAIQLEVEETIQQDKRCPVIHGVSRIR
jgi:hypothetical protein